MYYSAYCLQNNHYFNSGSNCKSYIKSAQEVLSMLLNGDDEAKEEDLNNIDNVKELLALYQVEIHSSKHKL